MSTFAPFPLVPRVNRALPALQRMARASAWVLEHRREGHEPRLDWAAGRLQVLNQRGERLEHPMGLLPELALLLHVPEPYALPMIPTRRMDGQWSAA